MRGHLLDRFVIQKFHRAPHERMIVLTVSVGFQAHFQVIGAAARDIRVPVICAYAVETVTTPAEPDHIAFRHRPRHLRLLGECRRAGKPEN